MTKIDLLRKKKFKETKIRSSFSSSTRSNTDKIGEQLEITFEIILQNKDLSISVNKGTLKYIIENFSNKNINIYDLCNQIGTTAANLNKLIEEIFFF
jgi:hypothetical protein